MISWFICGAHLHNFLLILKVIVWACLNSLAISSKHMEESLNLSFVCLLFNLRVICYIWNLKINKCQLIHYLLGPKGSLPGDRIFHQNKFFSSVGRKAVEKCYERDSVMHCIWFQNSSGGIPTALCLKLSLTTHISCGKNAMWSRLKCIILKQTKKSLGWVYISSKRSQINMLF